jgi:hypothetical protein
MTDRGLIHTREIVPVVQFLRNRTAEQRKKIEQNKCSSDVKKRNRTWSVKKVSV